MKKYIKDFLMRGLLAASGGPVVMAIVFGILGACGVVETLDVNQVATGILTVTFMAFVAAGITVVYEIEELPLGWAIGLHAVILYADYILIYLVNGWLKSQLLPVLIFTGVFVVGYAVIWLIIYFTTRAKTRKINKKLPKPGI